MAFTWLPRCVFPGSDLLRSVFFFIGFLLMDIDLCARLAPGAARKDWTAMISGLAAAFLLSGSDVYVVLFRFPSKGKRSAGGVRGLGGGVEAGQAHRQQAHQRPAPPPSWPPSRQTELLTPGRRRGSKTRWGCVHVRDS